MMQVDDAIESSAYDIVLANLWCEKAHQILNGSLTSLRPGGLLLALTFAESDASSPIYEARDKIRAAHAAGGLPRLGRMLPPSQYGDVTSSIAAIQSAAAKAGVELQLSVETIDSQLDLSGLLDTPPPPRSLRALSALLDVDAQALLSGHPQAYQTLVHELLGASLYNVTAPRDDDVGGDVVMRTGSGRGSGLFGPSGISPGSPSAARLHLYTPITAIVGVRTDGAAMRSVHRPVSLSSSSVTASTSSSSRSRQSYSHVKTTTSYSEITTAVYDAASLAEQVVEHCSYDFQSTRHCVSSSLAAAEMRSLSYTEEVSSKSYHHASSSSAAAGSLGADRGSAMIATAASLPISALSIRPPLSTLLSEPGWLRKNSDGSCSFVSSQRRASKAHASNADGDEDIAASSASKATDVNSFDVCFPHGDERGFFNYGLARWQQLRSGWKKRKQPGVGPSSRAASTSSSGTKAGSSSSGFSFGLPSFLTKRPSPSSSASESPPSSSSVDLDELFDMLSANEFTIPLDLPGRVRLSDLVATCCEIWELDSTASRAADNGSSSDW